MKEIFGIWRGVLRGYPGRIEKFLHFVRGGVEIGVHGPATAWARLLHGPTAARARLRHEPATARARYSTMVVKSLSRVSLLMRRAMKVSTAATER